MTVSAKRSAPQFRTVLPCLQSKEVILRLVDLLELGWGESGGILADCSYCVAP